MRVCWGYRGFILLPILVLGGRKFLSVPGTPWEVQMVGYDEGIQVTWVHLGRYSKVPLCSIRKVAKAADGADWDISSLNHPCTLATEWSDQLGVNYESARPQEDMPSPQRQKPQFTAAACLPHTILDTIQWEPASPHVSQHNTKRQCLEPPMHPTLLRVMLGVETAGVTWARIYGTLNFTYLSKTVQIRRGWDMLTGESEMPSTWYGKSSKWSDQS